MSILDDLDEIQDRADKATDGPWETHEDAPGEWLIRDVPSAEKGDLVGHAEALDESDAVFIAHARTDVPALVAALRRVEKLLAMYEKDEREHMRDFGQYHPYAGWAADHLRAAVGGTS